MSFSEGIPVCFRLFEKQLGYVLLSLYWEILNTVTARQQTHLIRYSMMVHVVSHMSAVRRSLINLSGLWLVKNHDWLFRVWSMKVFTTDGSRWHALSIDKHSLDGKKSTCWIACSISDSQVMELSFFLFSDKNRLPSFPLVPAIVCCIKMVINAVGWEGHYWSILSYYFIAPLEEGRGKSSEESP